MKMQINRNSLCLLVAGMLAILSPQANAKDYTARLDWAQFHYASVPVEGFVQEVLVHEGQHVKRGDKLVELNPTVLDASVMQSRAHVASLKPVLADAKREYTDAKALYEQTVLSDVELQRAKMSFDIAQAKLDEAESQLVANEALLARAAQYAPWDAWVIERNVETGEVIVGDIRNKPLIKLARADRWVAKTFISSEVRSRLSVGQTVKLHYENTDYDGQVQSVAMSVTGNSIDDAYLLRVEFAVDPGKLIRLGDAVTIELP